MFFPAPSRPVRRVAAVAVCLFGLVAGLPAQDNPENQSPPDGALSTPYRVEVLAQDLHVPWALAFLPDGRKFFTERTGRVRVLHGDTLLPEPALTIDVAQGNKMGMLGLAADPRFAENHFLYLAYDYRLEPFDPKHEQYRLRVVRYREENDKLLEAYTLIEDIPAWSNHTGCRLRFGPDGKLYLTTGDANDPPMAQRLDRYNGKILRIDPDGSAPEDNPFAKQAGARPEIWSYGHRNPQGLDFQPGTGRMIETEHGALGGDEVNWIAPGKNYGWPVIEHRRTHEGMETPLLEFSPAIAPGSTSFYRGDAFPELTGTVLVACLRGEGLLRVALDGEHATKVDWLFHHTFGRIRECAESPEGYLYVSTSQQDPDEGHPRPGDHDDLLLRIVPASVPPSGLPEFHPGGAEGRGGPALAAEARPLTGVRAVIAQNCAPCHGSGLAGGMQKSLVEGQWKYATDDQSIRNIIKNGLSEMGMPPAAASVTPQDVDALVSFIRAEETKNKR